MKKNMTTTMMTEEEKEEKLFFASARLGTMICQLRANVDTLNTLWKSMYVTIRWTVSTFFNYLLYKLHISIKCGVGHVKNVIFIFISPL
jgi:hypothetical protein